MQTPVPSNLIDTLNEYANEEFYYDGSTLVKQSIKMEQGNGIDLEKRKMMVSKEARVILYWLILFYLVTFICSILFV